MGSQEMFHNSGVEVRNEVRGIRDVLERWVKLNAEIARAWGVGDAPWYYGERGSVSVLAGAAWRLDGNAFMDFAEQKRRRGGRGRATARGYADLYMEVETRRYIAEAKQVWFSLGERADALGHLEEGLAEAELEAQRLDQDEWGTVRLGLVFGVPHVPAGMQEEGEAAWNRRVDEVLEDARQKLEWSFLAWAFPRLSREVLDDGLLYPGVFLVGKTV